MADYKEKIDEWQKTVRRKARELDEKFALSDLVGEGSRAAGNAAKRGAETIASGAEKLRSEAERLSTEGDFSETARRAAGEAVRGAEKAGKIIQDAAGDVGKQAGKTAGEVFDDDGDAVRVAIDECVEVVVRYLRQCPIPERLVVPKRANEVDKIA